MATWTSAAISLPLDGYCRAGRFFPIAVDGPDAGRSLVFTSEGCLPSRLEPQTGRRTILPMLETAEARELKWSDGSIPLHAPGEDERLIATVGDQAADAAALFPGKRLIPIRLDAADLLPGPPAAWETLDAVVLDSPMFERISDSQRSALLAGGVMLISIGEGPPDRTWPWRKVGAAWVLSCQLRGPEGGVMDEAVYAPTYGWAPGWSVAVRGQVVGAAVLLLLVITALLLRPTRLMVLAAVGLCLLATPGVILWRAALGSIDRAGGDILIAGDGLVQRDALVYQRAKESSPQVVPQSVPQIVPWTGWTHPLFASAMGLADSDIRLNLAANGTMSFNCKSAPGHTLAFLRREIAPGHLPAFTATRSSPMQELARLEYLQTGDRIAGETAKSQDRWAGVVIEKRGGMGTPIR